MQDFSAGDTQVPAAHAKYADPAMEALLLTLQKTIEENTGLSLYPTYSYYRVYRPGDVLVSHVDRVSCEISATLCFNFSEDCAKLPWPIFIEGNAVSLNPGDMVIYKGCELQHWREPFTATNDDSWHVQGFFHYVDTIGPYSNFKYDQRETVGVLPKDKKDVKVKAILGKPYIQYT
jgi:hypothetical protein